jgi:hypothetical protein
MKVTGYDLLEQEVCTRIKNNQNWLCTITGATGTGKSYIAMRMGEILADQLGVDFGISNIALDINEVLEMIESLKPGGIIIMDEAGVQYDARSFMTKRNKQLSKIFQMFRFKNLVLIWTLPDARMVDINARRLMHAFMETAEIDYERNLASAKFFKVFVDRWAGDIKHVYPRFSRGVITRVEFRKPNDELIQDYEAKKAEQFNVLLRETRTMLVSSSLSPSSP